MVHPVEQRPPAEALARLVERLSAWAVTSPRMGWHRFEEPTHWPHNLLDWLRAQSIPARYYWRERGASWAVAGLGEADVLSPLGGMSAGDVFEVQRGLDVLMPHLRYYGGFRFYPASEAPSRWGAFADFRFVVPAVELVREGDSYSLVANLLLKDGEDAAQKVASLCSLLQQVSFSDPPPPRTPPRPLSRHDTPNATEWEAMIDKALTEIHRGTMDKVVLARESVFNAPEPWNPFDLLSAWGEDHPNCYAFCFQPAGTRSFFGLSPERLFTRLSTYLRSEALAGTRPRGISPAEDRRQEQALVDSEKERREHAFVLQHITDLFGRLCRHAQVENPMSVVKMPSCQHLHSRIAGILLPSVDDEELLSSLHPTPALGGLPRARALEWMRREEPFDRGLYGAPVGWLSADAASFCVAIRSALAQDTSLALYTGAGIVEGSTPEEEWRELEAKLAAFEQALYQE